jgi:hypothetical protein
MAIVRISTAPIVKNDKADKYLNLDIHKKNRKYLLVIKILSVICAASVIFNIYTILN